MPKTEIYSFIHNVFIGIIALFPVINPIGNAFMFSPFFSGIERRERKRLVRKVAIYSFYICVVTLLSGNWILRLFGLSVPVVRCAGGILICSLGWNLLSGKGELGSIDDKMTPQDKERILESKIFYPLTFPITCGAGSISVLFTLSAQSAEKGFKGYLLNTSSILVSVIIMCLLVYFLYLNAELLMKHLSAKNELIVNRIMAFLIFCVGIQILSTGLMEFFPAMN